MNAAYKHLDSKLRIAELTLMQWTGLVIGVGIAIVWGFFLSPLGTGLTIGTAVYLGAIPGGLAIAGGFYELDIAILVRSAFGWRRLDGRFVAGPGNVHRGYVVRPDEHAAEVQTGPSTLDLSALWES